MIEENYYKFKTCEKTLGADYDGGTLVIKKEELKVFKKLEKYSDYPETVNIFIGEDYQMVRYLDFCRITGIKF